MLVDHLQGDLVGRIVHIGESLREVTLERFKDARPQLRITLHGKWKVVVDGRVDLHGAREKLGKHLPWWRGRQGCYVWRSCPWFHLWADWILPEQAAGLRERCFAIQMNKKVR